MSAEQDPIPPNRLRGSGVNRRFCLPRLPREYYQGDAVVHWNLPIALRATGWLTDAFHARFREVMLHAAAREGLCCPAYCLMPDHVHLLWMGLRRDTDQRNGMKFLREHLGPALRPHRFQHLPYDHVLREHERRRNAFARVCHYILENPFRAGLRQRGQAWPHCGACIPGYPTLHPAQSEFWPRFWRIFLSQRAADAGNIRRPPL